MVNLNENRLRQLLGNINQNPQMKDQYDPSGIALYIFCITMSDIINFISKKGIKTWENKMN